MFHGPLISIPVKAALVILAVLLITTGTIGMAKSPTEKGPTFRTFSELVEQQPHKGWFSVNDAYLDLSGSVVAANTHERGYYVPLRTTPHDKAPLKVVVYVTDKKLLNKIDSYNSSANRPMTLWGIKHPATIASVGVSSTISMNIRGMISQTMARGSSDYAELKDALSTSDNFLTINQDETPSVLVPILLLCFGGAVTVPALWILIMSPKIRPFGKTTDETWDNFNARRNIVKSS